MVYRLSRVSLWSVARMAFIISGSVGLAFGAFYGLILAVAGNLITLAFGGGSFDDLGLMSGVAGVFVTVFFGMFSGVVGALMSAILAWLYNIVAHLIGGICFEIEPESIAPEFTQSVESTLAAPLENSDVASPEQLRQEIVSTGTSSPMTNSQS